jgi:hypothetical protein
MKLIFDTLDALLTELHDRKVQVVRVSPMIHAETGARTAGIPQMTSRVLVTAALDEQLWAEWRLWVGRAMGEVGERGIHLPEWLRKKGDAALAEISKRVDDEGFQIREGIVAHDTAALDDFSLGPRVSSTP